MNTRRTVKFSLIFSSLFALQGCINGDGSGTQQSASPAEELVNNGSFAAGTDGWWAAGGQLARVDNMGCFTFTNGGANPWDVIFAQSGIPLAEGQSYNLSFTAVTKKPINAKILVQQDGAPYTNYFARMLN
ncbi:carbohydrate binding domain-containing protein [Klebsiella pneumoniae]|uniref:carbohydrate binding domain-containing protein n=1 Tax=Klebsiella pneumoniae TaxID=573 RepID=UPI001D12765C|nr:carbohydrate binding domain-containing protein [Klebsiella pneumoniae]